MSSSGETLSSFVSLDIWTEYYDCIGPATVLFSRPVCLNIPFYDIFPNAPSLANDVAWGFQRAMLFVRFSVTVCAVINIHTITRIINRDALTAVSFEV